MNLAQFLPSYPIYDEQIRKGLGNLLPNSDFDPDFELYRKWEFYENKLDLKTEPKRDDFYNHQRIIGRFMSAHTPYSGLLLMHEPGSGKSHSAIHAVELIRNNSSWSKQFQGALILTKNEDLYADFREKITELYEMWERPDPPKEIKQFYEFKTILTFANEYNRSNVAGKKVEEKWLDENVNHRVIIIDEVHHLRQTKESSTYNLIKEILHKSVGCKVLLMSGTPMFNTANEIALIMNLILPTTEQMQQESEFDRIYLDKSLRHLNPENVDQLKKYFHGRVSYMKSVMDARVKKVYVGDLMCKETRLQAVDMSETQTRLYRKFYEHANPNVNDADDDDREDQKNNIYRDAKLASNLVMPDGTVSDKNLETYVEIDKSTLNVQHWKVGMSDSLFSQEQSIQEKLNSLRQYGAKFAQCMQCIKDHPKELHFVYFDMLKSGSGGAKFFLFLIRDIFGQQNPGKFRLIDGDTSRKDFKDILDQFNQNSNATGKNIQVLIGTKKLAEAVTIKNVRHIHLMEVPFNFTKMDQALARGYRLSSHDYLLDILSPDATIDVFCHLYCSLPHASTLQEKKELSVDYFLYNHCIKKDYAIKAVERVIQEASFDCALTYERNHNVDSVWDTQRECQYQSCEYRCDGISNDDFDLSDNMIDFSTYNLFYTESIRKDIVRLLYQLVMIHKRYKITVEELSEKLELTDKNKSTLWGALIQLHNNNVTDPDLSELSDCFENRLYMHLQGNYVFFTHTPQKQISFFESFYACELPLFQPMDSEDIMQSTFIDFVVTDSLDFVSTWNQDQLKEYIAMLPRNLLNDLFETCVKMQYFNLEVPEKMEPLYQLILQTYKNAINLQNKPGIGLISKLQPAQMRVLDSKTQAWRDCTADEKLRIENEGQVNTKKLLESGILYFGTIDGVNNKFKIYDFTQPTETTKSGVVDTRTSIRGKVCSEGWTVMSLMKLLEEFEIDWDKNVDTKSNLLPAITIIKNLNEDEELDEAYTQYYQEKISRKTSEQGRSPLWSAFPREPVDEWSELSKKSKKRALIWAKFTKNILCDRVQAFFRNPLPDLNRKNMLRLVNALELDADDDDGDMKVDIDWDNYNSLPRTIRKAFDENAWTSMDDAHKQRIWNWEKAYGNHTEDMRSKIKSLLPENFSFMVNSFDFENWQKQGGLKK